MKKVSNVLLLLQSALLLLATGSAHALRNDRRHINNSNFHAEQQMDRVRYVMLPLLRVTNQRVSLDDIRISIADDAAINAASGGNGQFYVTTGLLRQASDNQLRGVLAHEIAHEDLGHPTKAQVFSAGLSVGAALLEKILPGSSSVAPIAGTILAGHYTKPMELEADRHAIKLLQRAGYSKDTMIDTLAWLLRRNGDTGGGIFATHPATSERIQALRSLR